MKYKIGGIAAAAVVFAVGCGGSKEETSNSAATPNAVSIAETKPTTSSEPCRPDGLWSECAVEKRLKQSGFVPQKNAEAAAPRSGLTATPAVYTLNKSRLELYFYKDAQAVNAAVSKVDTAAIAPVFIRSANLIALLFTDDATQAERLSLALTAGPPQR